MGTQLQESKKRKRVQFEGHRFLEQMEFIRGMGIQGYQGMPISSYLEDLMNCIEKNQIMVIVVGDTDGATSLIPVYMHETVFSKTGKIVCTRPCPAAALRVAAQVSRQRGFILGHEVGYSTPFKDITSEATFIKYSTDQLLLRELLVDYDLTSYSVVMVSDAQERTVSTDILLSLLKDTVRCRKDMKLLILCTTLNAGSKFSDYFDEAPVFVIRESSYPVEVYYTKAPEADYVNAAVVTALQVHVTEPPGDILIILTEQDEVEFADKILEQRKKGLGSKRGELRICPLSENTPTKQVSELFESTSEVARKVILATHVSETVKKLEGVKYVVDPGFTKMKLYDPKARSEYLMISPISKSVAKERAILSAKASPGKCYRLYTAFSFYNMKEETVPQIQRSDLVYFVLILKRNGINDLVNYDFIDPPSAEALMRSLEELYALMALNKYGQLVQLGATMSVFPLNPKLARMILASAQYNCLDDVVCIAAILSSEDLFCYHSKKRHIISTKFHSRCACDHMALLNVYNEWKANNFSSKWCVKNNINVLRIKQVKHIRDQLEELLGRLNIKYEAHATNIVSIKKSITTGFCTHIAKLQKDGSYRKVNCPDTPLYIHPSSELAQELPRLVVFYETLYEDRDFMHIVTEINRKCVLEIAPHMLLDLQENLPRGRGMKMLPRQSL